MKSNLVHNRCRAVRRLLALSWPWIGSACACAGGTHGEGVTEHDPLVLQTSSGGEPSPSGTSVHSTTSTSADSPDTDRTTSGGSLGASETGGSSRGETGSSTGSPGPVCGNGLLEDNGPPGRYDFALREAERGHEVSMSRSGALQR